MAPEKHHGQFASNSATNHKMSAVGRVVLGDIYRWLMSNALQDSKLHRLMEEQEAQVGFQTD